MPADWQIIYYNNDIACNLAIAWNTSKISLVNSKSVLLPMPKKQTFIWRFTNYYGLQLQRGALTAVFSVNGKSLRITNVHLACEANMAHRAKQLKYLLEDLNKQNIENEILVGDFNTVGLSTFRRSQEKKVEQALGEAYKNIFPNIKWTLDTSDFDPRDGYGKFLACMKIRFRVRLDYIFSKNLKLIVAEEMTNIAGSDHRPLLASFEV